MRILNVHAVGAVAAIKAAISVLQAGGIIVYPTETTYGIGIDVENPAAVEKLLQYKGKRDGKAISVAVKDQQMAERYVKLNPAAKKVYETFLPGPVTVVSTGTGIVAPGVPSSDGKVGIRIPKHDFALELIQAFGHGISATGANASNKKRPYAIQDILDNTSTAQQELIDLALDFGELPHNEPSTVIDTTLDDIAVLRQGQISFKATETIETQSEEETIAWFESFAKRFRSYYTYEPVLFLFSGEMGAGKTHAIKGLAKGLGIAERITSPTYTFANEYSFLNESRNGIFVHIDCWRLHTFAEILDLGLETYMEKKAVLAIEWSERFAPEWETYKVKAKIIRIDIKPAATETSRRISYAQLS